MRTCLLMVIGIVVGAGCATSPRRGDPPWSPGVGQAQGGEPKRDTSRLGTRLAPTVAPPSDVGSARAPNRDASRLGTLPHRPSFAGGSPSQPQNNAAGGPVNSSGETAFDELEAELAQKQVSVADPLEPVNRFMFGVNDVVYFWILKPVLQVYVGAVSKEARTGIRNFFHNLATPARLVNCILQGKSSGADIELRRFAVNTVVGVLGLGDPARDRWGLKPAEEDLGQTLAVYGLGDGFYLVWPLLGPSTLRDSVGLVGDAFLDPVRYVQPEAASIGISATSTVNDGSFRLGEYESLKAATVDPYIAMRQAYVQYRKKQIRGEDLPTDPNSAKP